ncbi:ABC1 family-domain-containing protein [Crepidotus variabilis]|uniref:ABC1 family-domain-containing protein n=1 Tax=Crepidotus variabilis TaxID=179855 RepID=A0A9P6JT83_9AGAR|nr:ABC1 family-domain-containing protein [Crepidotus variabilis]
MLLPRFIHRSNLQHPYLVYKSAFTNQSRGLSRSKPIRNHRSGFPTTSPWIFYPTCALVLGGTGLVAYETSQPFRHTVLAVARCSRVAGAAFLSAVDYKTTMIKSYKSTNEENQAYSECHTRSANRVLKALLANGGIFIKIGQHMASLIVLPQEWTQTMSILQDKCDPTPYEDLEAMFFHDTGTHLEEVFDDFQTNPIGVASLAQVHVGRHKISGKPVAVKLQHPHLDEFCNVDMEMVDVTLGWIKYWFPQFEFTWLASEMRTNLPREMNFVIEAENAARTISEFANMRTPLYIPQVISASKRVLVMEFIQGGRVDDLPFLAQHNIDRNKVAIELSRIFNQMVFINGWFHADPHPGNLLIRPAPPAPPSSRSPYNFEIVLLDHGLYFDLSEELRFNYAKLWLALIAPASPSTIAERKKYAKLVGNIGPDLYPVFEAAITGRIALEGSWEGEDDDENDFQRASSMIKMSRQTDEERDAIRNAVVSKEGVLISVFDVLRRIPSRVLMVLKLNDLTRSLDRSLNTTHADIRIFLVMAKYCVKAVWRNNKKSLINKMQSEGLLRFSLLSLYFSSWWRYQTSYKKLSCVEMFMDIQASLTKTLAWMHGLWSKGFTGAHNAAFGLPLANI